MKLLPTELEGSRLEFEIIEVDGQPHVVRCRLRAERVLPMDETLELSSRWYCDSESRTSGLTCVLAECDRTCRHGRLLGYSGS